MVALLNIVVVEDHDALREVTVEALRGEGHHVAGVDCAEALADQLGVMPVDLMVVDLNLPGEDGISLTRRIRRTQPDIGIIMVTARGQPAEKMEGYESGADIYLTKPTSLGELSAAIQALSRRLKRSAPAATALRLDLGKLSLAGQEEEVGLTAYEAAILCAFVRAPGQRLENWQLIELLSKSEADYSKARLEVQIFRLRRKLTQAGAGIAPVKVLRLLGYQLCVPIVVL
ncbi:MAG: response regulator transcription factor [Burkholderiaceae bacterium]|nr:response regulator transcription factor [Burkholderiaceae bacterium]